MAGYFMSLHSAPPASRQGEVAALSLGALGVVFGDIGTSPLYAFKEAFGGPHALPRTEANVLGILSLLFWSVMLVVSLKYVSFVMRFDNKGEGGVLALLALSAQLFRKHPRLSWFAGLIAIFAASLFYGDAVITPAISVLSAVEGLSVVTPAFAHWVVPLTLVIIVTLFWMQSGGTGKLGRIFGPVTLLWFVVIGGLGVASILQTPSILRALNPAYAAQFAMASPALTFLALGAVFLTLTGGEALYADMGHFGRVPIRIAWFSVVLPALMLNYLGQGALVLRNPAAAKNPFYLLAPADWVLPMVVLATVATVIASQATISGAFSVTQQASRLGFLPRIPVTHTSETERGQVYIGKLNWLMLVLVVLLVSIVIGLLLWGLLTRTRMGMMIRAGVDDRGMLSASGVNVQRIFAMTFALGAGLAGLAGVVGGTALSISPGEDTRYLLASLVVVIVGGMGSVPGAAIGALLIGLAEQFGQAYAPTYSVVFTFVIMILALAFRPRGVLGKAS